MLSVCNRDPTAPISVLLAHTEALVRECITLVLSRAHIKVVAKAATLSELRQEARQLAPDVVLLDWHLVLSDPDSPTALTAELDGLPMVALVCPCCADSAGAALEAGVEGCLSVDIGSDELINGLKAVARGDIVISRDVITQVRDGKPDDRAEDGIDVLSGREKEVLALLAAGASNKEIAHTLFITQNTVKVHMRNILYKLKLRNRSQAAAYGVRTGMLADLRIGGRDGNIPLSSRA